MQRSEFSIAMKLKGLLVVLALALVSTLSFAQASNASLTGTYTFAIGAVSYLSIQYNMSGQQVGFCFGTIPQTYSCGNQLGQDVITGTLVADGKGNIVAGSNYVYTTDPNSYQCSSKAAPHCPYKVPVGIAWSSTVSYVGGDEVDLKNGAGTSLTYQAAKNNLGVMPGLNTNTCSNNGNPPPSCTWVELYSSAAGKNNSAKGTLTGKYTVQPNGSGVLQVTPSGGGGSASFAIVVPTTASAVGQQVSIVGLPTLGNKITGGGAAVRIK
jgi:hypothetical protein